MYQFKYMQKIPIYPCPALPHFLLLLFPSPIQLFFTLWRIQIQSVMLKLYYFPLDGTIINYLD